MNNTTTDRIELARELMGYFIEGEAFIGEGNEELFTLLGGDDEEVFLILPGETVEAVRANIVTALELASQPGPYITGRNQDERRMRSGMQRMKLQMACRVALALVEPAHTDSSDAAAKLAAIKAILEGGAA